jgi:hypothetical protein
MSKKKCSFCTCYFNVASCHVSSFFNRRAQRSYGSLETDFLMTTPYNVDTSSAHRGHTSGSHAITQERKSLVTKNATDDWPRGLIDSNYRTTNKPNVLQPAIRPSATWHGSSSTSHFSSLISLILTFLRGWIEIFRLLGHSRRKVVWYRRVATTHWDHFQGQREPWKMGPICSPEIRYHTTSRSATTQKTEETPPYIYF